MSIVGRDADECPIAAVHVRAAETAGSVCIRRLLAALPVLPIDKNPKKKDTDIGKERHLRSTSRTAVISRPCSSNRRAEIIFGGKLVEQFIVI